MPDATDVLRVNAAFYDAFAHGDLTGMESLWAKRVYVACAHPGWPLLRGRDQVMAAWRSILQTGGVPVKCVEPTAHVAGDGAFVVCYEQVGSQVLAATNYFVREEGRWLLAHHQAGPSQRPEAKAATPPPPPKKKPDSSIN